MARITVEDCLKKVNNRFALIHMAAKRVRQLRKGAEPSIVSKNRDVVVALREIAAGHVIKAEQAGENYLIGKIPDILPEGEKAQMEESAQNDEKGEGDSAEG